MQLDLPLLYTFYAVNHLIPCYGHHNPRADPLGNICLDHWALGSSICQHGCGSEQLMSQNFSRVIFKCRNDITGPKQLWRLARPIVIGSIDLTPFHGRTGLVANNEAASGEGDLFRPARCRALLQVGPRLPVSAQSPTID